MPKTPTEVRDRYEEIEAKRPGLAPYALLAEALKGSGLTEEAVRGLFYDLVPVKDTVGAPKPDLIQHLHGLATV